MASEVDICNLSLANLGDSATIASLNPPEGSAQAEHCARFYPIARDSLLEMHPWSFATSRIQLAELTNDSDSWSYAYALPSGLIRMLTVLPPEAGSDYDTGASYPPQPYVREVNSSGAGVIRTNQQDAVGRYIRSVTDTTRFSPLFILTLSWHLASMLAGPVIKGDAGKAEAKRCAEGMRVFLMQAKESDANQRHAQVTHRVPWMSGR